MTALYHYQRYTDDERDWLAENSAGRPRGELARELGRTREAVKAYLRKHPELRGPGRRSLPACESDLRRLHASGLNDIAIALALGVCADTAGTWRRRLGLPANMSRADCGRLSGPALRSKARSLGEPSWAKHVQARRAARHAQEFRGCRTAVEVAICRRLAEGGPQTSAQLVAALPHDRSHARRCLRALLEAGVVTKGGRIYSLAVPHGGGRD